MVRSERERLSGIAKMTPTEEEAAWDITWKTALSCKP